MLLEPNKQTKGIKFDIVKFFIFELLFSENIGWRWARKLKNITPQAHTSTALP